MKRSNLVYRMRSHYQLYLFFLPTFIYYLIFHFQPMYGLLIAFKKFSPVQGIWNSEWVGFKHFIQFFNSYQFFLVIRNTVELSFLQLFIGFPFVIALALVLNQVRNKHFKKFVQTITYAPHFISVVVLVGMLFVFLSPSSGIVNIIIQRLGGEPVAFMSRPEWFRPLYVISGIWQNAGWDSIIYLAALAGINPELHEAAIVDGATRMKRIIHVDIPGILPTMVTMLILSMGRIMSIGFEKSYLMQLPLNLETSEIISTYVYKVGLINAQYSFSTAVGLFNSIVNLILILTVNKVADRLSGNNLW